MLYKSGMHFDPRLLEDEPGRLYKYWILPLQSSGCCLGWPFLQTSVDPSTFEPKLSVLSQIWRQVTWSLYLSSSTASLSSCNRPSTCMGLGPLLSGTWWAWAVLVITHHEYLNKGKKLYVIDRQWKVNSVKIASLRLSNCCSVHFFTSQRNSISLISSMAHIAIGGVRHRQSLEWICRLWLHLELVRTSAVQSFLVPSCFTNLCIIHYWACLSESRYPSKDEQNHFFRHYTVW